MPEEKPVPPENKSTKADTYKRFSHERPAPDTNPPIIEPIQLQPPKEPPKPKPQPKPNNTDSDK